jgi:hypothetical protein
MVKVNSRMTFDSFTKANIYFMILLIALFSIVLFMNMNNKEGAGIVTETTRAMKKR